MSRAMDPRPRTPPKVSPLHLATLAGLTLGAEEAVRLGQDVERIVAYMGALADVDTQGIAPLASPNEEPSPLRADVPSREVAPADILASAPKTEGDAFVVPKILEGTSK